jgi:hypothetical protein
MDNASLILLTLDSHLDHAARLVLYGRAALQLGFTDPRHDRITPVQLESALAEAVIPDLVELRDALERAKPRVRELARRTEH